MKRIYSAQAKEPSARLLTGREEIVEALGRHRIPHEMWGTKTPYTLERLLKTLKEDRVFLQENETGLTLAVHNAVAIVQAHHRGRLMELWEEFQRYKHNGRKVKRGFRGIAETLWRHEWPLYGIYRVLTEEPGQKVNRFKDPAGYALTHLPAEIDGPKPSEKWIGLQAVFIRNIYHCYLVDPRLYKPRGYVEDQKDKTTHFGWRPARKRDRCTPLPLRW